MKIHPATITKAINRFARAVEDKAFEGTIPFDSDRALEAHYQIDVEFIKSREALERLFIKAQS